MMTEDQKQKSRLEFYDKVKSGHITSLTEVKEFKGYKVGQSVLLKNGNGVIVGPFEILGFDKFNKMFLNWDCYWFAVPVDRIVKVVSNE